MDELECAGLRAVTGDRASAAACAAAACAAAACAAATRAAAARAAVASGLIAPDHWDHAQRADT
jgi:hypothetical protein